MKVISKHTKDSWLSGDYMNHKARRPIVRATIQKGQHHLVDYRVRKGEFRTWGHEGKFASALFGMENRPRELKNIKSVSWQRGVDTDVATCKITLFNARALLPGETPPNRWDFDLPGWYTPNRGQDKFFRRWNYEENHWRDWLVPDRIVRTYEGYGFDEDIAPEKDPKMYPSGVWLIDDVAFTTDGMIELSCRDIGRLLLDHILFPPVVPWDVYPIYWSPFETKARKEPVHRKVDINWATPRYDTDSNQYFRNLAGSEVNPNGYVNGHHGRHAFDERSHSFWVSTGERPQRFTYVQGQFSQRRVEGVRVVVKGGPYRMFVSLRGPEGAWKGRSKIPYKAGEVNTNADVRYVDSYIVRPGENIIRLPKKYEECAGIRLTFTRLWYSGWGQGPRHRAAVRAIQVASDMTTSMVDNTYTIGNYGDFTDIVKWMCAWAGFYWPRGGSGIAFHTNTDGTRNRLAPANDDPVLPKGRVWGDFEQSGTTGEVELGVEMFDKQPVMDGIGQIREMTGFDFWIDETGGVIWRLPNIFKRGNYIMPREGGARGNHTDEIPVIDERTTLISMTATLGSSNVREQVFIGNIAGKIGAVVEGYNPNPTGMRRVGGWTDQKFESERECERMADLIALKQSFRYRTNQVTIAANPQIQVDDQVRIYERTTGEGYIHRVLSISCEFDNETGKWTYDLTTHWMGEEVGGRWAFDPELLKDRTKQYLRNLGKIA